MDDLQSGGGVEWGMSVNCNLTRHRQDMDRERSKASGR